MKNNRKIAFIIALIVTALVLLTSCGENVEPQDNGSVVGRWELVKSMRLDNGKISTEITSVIEYVFSQDGQYVYQNMSGSWAWVDDNKNLILITNYRSPSKSHNDFLFVVWWEGETLVLTDDNLTRWVEKR